MKPYFENIPCLIASVAMLTIKTCAFCLTMLFPFPLFLCFGGIGLMEMFLVLLMSGSLLVLCIGLAVIVLSLIGWIYSLVRLTINGRGAGVASVLIMAGIGLDVFCVVIYLLGGAGIYKIIALIFDLALLLLLALLRRSRPKSSTVISC